MTTLNGYVLHVQYRSQRELCRAFVRVQEFYESPFPEIRGRGFTLDYFKQRYARSRPGGRFTYYEDWHGFNVPGHIVRQFFGRFYDLSEPERHLMNVCTAINPENFYLIGTFSDEEVSHELCHAMYYLDPEYKKRADALVQDFYHKWPKLSFAICKMLLDAGYDESVMTDEMQAYLATTDESWWAEHLGPSLARMAYDKGEPFRRALVV